jgi:hypothetical protein
MRAREPQTNDDVQVLSYGSAKKPYPKPRLRKLGLLRTLTAMSLSADPVVGHHHHHHHHLDDDAS